MIKWDKIITLILRKDPEGEKEFCNIIHTLVSCCERMLSDVEGSSYVQLWHADEDVNKEQVKHKV